MKCNNCGTENPDEALFCKNCGARLDGNATCPHCGKLLPADSKFCMYCGYRFGDAYAQTNVPRGRRLRGGVRICSRAGVCA